MRAAMEDYTLVISDYVVEELYEVVRRKFPNRIGAIDEFLRQLPHEHASNVGARGAEDVH